MATMKIKDVLTTGEVAKICSVAPRTVSKWFDSGALHGYRIPGSKDRRIPLNQLIRFMKQHGMPLNGLMSGGTRVMIVDDEQDIVEVLEKILRTRPSTRSKAPAPASPPASPPKNSARTSSSSTCTSRT